MVKIIYFSFKKMNLRKKGGASVCNLKVFIFILDRALEFISNNLEPFFDNLKILFEFE